MCPSPGAIGVRTVRRKPGALAGRIAIAEGFSLLPITTAHAAAYRRLPYVELGGKPQRDPFDRLLVAQSIVEGVPLVTCDPGIAAHGVPTLW